MSKRNPFRPASNLALGAILGFLSWYAAVESKSIPWSIGYAVAAFVVIVMGFDLRKKS